MTLRNTFVLAMGLAVALSVSGCGSLEKLTGMGRDDTVLPGQRENAIPGKASFPDQADTVKPGTTLGDTTAQQPQDGAAPDAIQETTTQQSSGLEPVPVQTPAAPGAPCKPTDQKCKLAAAKAAKAAATGQQGGDTFNDPVQ